MDFKGTLLRLSLEPDAAVMHEVIGFAKSGAMKDDDIGRLATVLAESGDVLRPETHGVLADVASTGGASSLSTLLCPLFLRCFGASVPKLGVSGRPAGAVDVLTQVPGYRVVLGAQEVTSILARCGYVHFIAGGEHAPLDGLLFAYRRTVGAVAVPELAIASLLSKKLAVGLRRVGLDVRVSPLGNFGDTWLDAKRNAERFIRVAALLGMQAWCFLTEGVRPCQPFIGRGEALLAVAEVVSGTAAERLSDHAHTCFAMARAVAGGDSAPFPSPETLRAIIEQNLEAQGSDLCRFVERTAAIRRRERRPILASGTGFLCIDLGRIRQVLVSANETEGAEHFVGGTFPDRAGVTLQKKPGVYVLKGECVAEFRCDEVVHDSVASGLPSAFTISPDGGELFGFETIHG